MTKTDAIGDFLKQKRLALVGVSQKDKSFSRLLFENFLKRGYDVVPVNPGVPEVDGIACAARVGDIDPPVENALLLTRPEVSRAIVRECAEAGIKRVWLHRGAGHGCGDPEAVAFCRLKGIEVIDNECPMMHLENAGWFHRAHGWIRGFTAGRN